MDSINGIIVSNMGSQLQMQWVGIQVDLFFKIGRILLKNKTTKILIFKGLETFLSPGFHFIGVIYLGFDMGSSDTLHY